MRYPIPVLILTAALMLIAAACATPAEPMPTLATLPTPVPEDTPAPQEPSNPAEDPTPTQESDTLFPEEELGAGFGFDSDPLEAVETDFVFIISGDGIEPVRLETDADLICDVGGYLLSSSLAEATRILLYLPAEVTTGTYSLRDSGAEDTARIVPEVVLGPRAVYASDPDGVLTFESFDTDAEVGIRGSFDFVVSIDGPATQSVTARGAFAFAAPPDLPACD